MNPRPSWRRRIQLPWISAVLLALIAADAWWVLKTTSYVNESRAAVLVMQVQDALFGPNIERQLRYDYSRIKFGDGVWLSKHPALGLYLVREGDPATTGRLRLVDEDAESWDELSRLSQNSPDRVAAVEILYGIRRTGFWALTREHLVDVVRIDPWEAGSFEDVTSDVVRSIVAPHVSHNVAPTGPADQSSTRILPWGYAHNAAALFTLGAFIFSLGWVPRLPAAYRARRGKRRLVRGLCPRCRYHLAGLEAERCPECGEQWGGSSYDKGPERA